MHIWSGKVKKVFHSVSQFFKLRFDGLAWKNAWFHYSWTDVISFDSLLNYRQVSNIRRTLVSNKPVDHSDVVGASPVGAAPTTSSFST